MTPGTASDGGPWKSEATEVVRAVAGGLLFGVPLLYTMEVWWVGSHSEPEQMLLLLALLVVPLFALNKTAGFRTSRDVSAVDALGDTVEAIAIGLVTTAAVLLMLRELTLATPLEAGLGKVVYESVPFCLGIGVARFLVDGDPRLSADDDGGGDDGGGPEGEGDDRGEGGESGELNATIADMGATVLGATFIGLSIAPTDEIPMIASAMDPLWQIVVVAASLATSYAIVFVAGFSRQDERHAQEGVFQRPRTETIVTYLLALCVAGALLWLFQRDVDPLDDLLSRTVVLAFPAAIGGAVGRLAL